LNPLTFYELQKLGNISSLHFQVMRNVEIVKCSPATLSIHPVCMEKMWSCEHTVGQLSSGSYLFRAYIWL